jgi:TPR repeat protein
MRWLIAIGVALVVGTGVARAQTQTDIVCGAFEQKWGQISGGTDVQAMQALIAHIPPSCPLRARAERRLRAVEAGSKPQRSGAETEARRSHAGGGEAGDDSAYAIARAAGSIAAYDAYLQAYPRGRHAGEARAARQALAGPRQPAAPAQVSASEAYNKGEAAFGARDYDQAMHWYQIAAQDGDANAELGIGGLYFFGEGVTLDYAEAMHWYRLAGDQGLAPAQYAVGSLYEHGQGVAQDYGEAMRWYRLAAAQGYAKAIVNIGSLYFFGHGVTQNYGEAARQYKIAADQQNADGEYNLGILYARGLGVAQNMATARALMNRAAEHGDQDARAWLNHNPE